MQKFSLFFLLLLLTSFSFAAPEKLTIILDWYINPDHAPLIVAEQQGFFKQQNLTVELISPADPADAPKLVAAGKADIGINYEPELVRHVDAGIPVVRMGSLINQPLNCLTALEESGIRNIDDLKGKRIGTGGGLTDILLKIMLEKRGLSINDVELVNVHYNLTQGLLAGKVEAVTGIMRNIEVPQIELIGKKTVNFYPENYGIPRYDELIFITNPKLAHDPRLPRFLTAIKASVAYLRAHPESTWQAYAKAYPESNNEVNRSIWFATIPFFATDPSAINIKEWEQFVKFMRLHQLIKNEKPIMNYAIKV
jgi:putative hydroxymethylpyrimidine transport system substrate-binding protein